MLEAVTTHGVSKTRLYSIWSGMMERCGNKASQAYKDYGGRGIKVCPEWHDILAFKDWAENNGYDPNLQIDRRNNDGNYAPENCRWVTPLTNANNKRLISICNTSGFAGVHAYKDKTLYMSRTRSSLIPLFTASGFKSAAKAAIARDLHIIRHGGHLNHGIPLNFPELAVQGPL
jgi:hypothetical protein